MDASSPPLSDLRVLDLTQFLSGPYCTQMLADLGAEVIKLEGPEGDLARKIPPHFVGEDSVYFLAVNRGKKGVLADLKTAEGKETARRLALASDVIVENFRPGVLSRLGLNVDELRRERPALIWCSISGYGQTGPDAAKPAYDMIIQAVSGGMSLTGEPGRTAVRAGIPVADICAGMYATSAILAALHRRQKTGLGDRIDISMLDCQAAMLSYQAAYYLHSGIVPGRQGSGHDSIPTYRSFETRTAEIVITANTERMWQGLCKALDLPDLLKDARFKTNADRYENRHALWPLLEQRFRCRSAVEWIERLEAEGVPAGIVNSLDQVMKLPQIVHRNMVLELSAADGRKVRVTGNPFVFEQAGAPAYAFPPKLGEHSDEICRRIPAMQPAVMKELSE